MTLWGFSWDKSAAGVYTRLNAAVGLNPIPYVTGYDDEGYNIYHASDFDTIGPWMTRRCNVWDDGTVTAYYGDPEFTDTDVENMGQVMVEYPNAYYYIDTQTSGLYKFFISDDPTDVVPVAGSPTVKIHPIFLVDGVPKDHAYIGAYEGFINPSTSMLESRGLVQPDVGKTIAQYRAAAQARGTGWGIETIQQVAWRRLLFSVEFARFDSQAALGAGKINNGIIYDTGQTAGMGSRSWGNPNADRYPVSHRGYENPWGSTKELIDGVNIQGDSNYPNLLFLIWVLDQTRTAAKYAGATYDGVNYINTTLAFPPGVGYISDIGIANPYDWMFLPKTFGGSDTTYFCDAAACYGGDSALTVGGAITESLNAGLFWSYAYDVDDTYSHGGARLSYLEA